jgi:peroxiredoxin
VSLLALAALAGADEIWDALEREWTAALVKYEAKLARTRSRKARARIPHPFAEYASRLHAEARRLANTPAALGPLLVLVNHSDDPEVRLWVMVQLRENHLRQEGLGDAVPGLVRDGSAEALRTLEEIAERSPILEVKASAKAGYRELTELMVGKEAPTTTARDEDGRPLGLHEQRGKAVLLLFVEDRKDPRVKQVRRLAETYADRPLVILGAGTLGEEWRSWALPGSVRTRWNATDRPRTFVLDHRGVIRHKDLWGEELADAVQKSVADAERDG